MYNHTASHPHSRGLPWRALREREEEERERERGKIERERGEIEKDGKEGEEEEERRGEGGRGYIYTLQQKSHTTLVYTYTVLMNGSRVKACGVMAISLLLSIFL